MVTLSCLCSIYNREFNYLSMCVVHVHAYIHNESRNENVTSMYMYLYKHCLSAKVVLVLQYQTKITYVSRENHANFNACSQKIEFTGAQETFPCSCFTTLRVIRFYALYKLINIIT